MKFSLFHIKRTKYRFNPVLLVYEKYRLPKSTWFLRIFGVLSIFFISGFVMYLLFINYLDSPKEKQLKREIKNYELHYELLNSKLEQLELVIQNLESRDKNVYRTIFEAEPLPSSITKMGYGGIEKYKALEGYDNSELIIETTKKTDKLSKQLYVLSKSFDEISLLASRKKEMLSCIPAIQPVNNKQLSMISSGFGVRIDPIYKVKKFHYGLDFTARVGTPVYATGDGKVIEAEYNRGGYGMLIVIDNGFGYRTLFAHLSKFYVRKGQKVKRGELIGAVGNTGKSTAPHLHYEVHKGKSRLNPVYFFSNDLTPEEYEMVLNLSEQAKQTLD
jgi:murein DD-endopeptidase MepM/ murein hydrolase activator NlpD